MSRKAFFYFSAIQFDHSIFQGFNFSPTFCLSPVILTVFFLLVLFSLPLSITMLFLSRHAPSPAPLLHSARLYLLLSLPFFFSRNEDSWTNAAALKWTIEFHTYAKLWQEVSQSLSWSCQVQFDRSLDVRIHFAKFSFIRTYAVRMYNEKLKNRWELHMIVQKSAHKLPSNPN